MTKSQTESYDRLRRELDDILADLQGGNLDIDQALKAYGRGQELVKKLEQYLESAENTVSELKAKLNKNA